MPLHGMLTCPPNCKIGKREVGRFYHHYLFDPVTHALAAQSHVIPVPRLAADGDAALADGERFIQCINAACQEDLCSEPSIHIGHGPLQTGHG